MCDVHLCVCEHNQQIVRHKFASRRTHEFSLPIHRTVIDTLKTVDDSRKCFRLIGGVLCERTVKNVLPQLNDAKEHLEKLVGQRQEQLTEGIDMNKFEEKHNFRISDWADGPTVFVAGQPTEENRNHVLFANWLLKWYRNYVEENFKLLNYCAHAQHSLVSVQHWNEFILANSLSTGSIFECYLNSGNAYGTMPAFPLSMRISNANSNLQTCLAIV